MGSSSSGAISLFREALRQLREQAQAGSDGAALTGLLREAFTCRNEFDATLTALVAELDRVERARPDERGSARFPAGCSGRSISLARPPTRRSGWPGSSLGRPWW